MRAVVLDRYGPPELLRLDEVARPVPGPGQVLVEIHAATLNRTDCGFRSARPWITRFFSGIRGPKFRVGGSEFAGVVVEAAPDVTEFAVGDRVFGVDVGGFGAHAEYKVMAAGGAIAKLPDGITFDEGAAVCDGIVLADNYLQRVDLGPGRRLCVYGASGSIGTAAVQLAKHLYGATVTAIATAETADLLRSLGADEVFDHRAVDFTRRGEQYDVILDAVGKRSFSEVRRALTPRGIYCHTELGRWWQNPVLALITRRTPTRKLLFPVPVYRKPAVELAARLLAEGRYRAVIDRRYPLEQIVEATHYVESEQKVGNVVLQVRR